MSSPAPRVDALHDSTWLVRALWACLAFAAVVLGLFAFATYTTAASRPPVIVLLVLTAVAVIFELSLVRDGASPFFEIGGFFAAVTFLYGAYPILAYLANGLTYTPTNDVRFFAGQPEPWQMAIIGWYYVAFLASFALVYRLTRGRSPSRLRVRPANKTALVITWILFALIELAIIAARRFFSLNSGGYEESYAAVRNLPTLLRQIYLHGYGMLPTLILLILCALFARYRKNRVTIVLFFAGFGAIVVYQGGSRAYFFLLLFAAIALYHHLVRPLTLRVAIPLGVAALLAFTFLGYIRGGGDGLTVNVFQKTNEFEAIFANAYDLKYVQHAEGTLLSHPELRLVDVIALIPSQFLPFTKATPADWYLQTYYPWVFESGGGVVFGVVAEAVTGYGWIELPFRGAFLGLLFGLLHRRCSRRVLTPWLLAFYVWVTMWSFDCVRNTTMPLLTWLLYQFFVPVTIVYVLTRAVSRRTWNSVNGALRG